MSSSSFAQSNLVAQRLDALEARSAYTSLSFDNITTDMLVAKPALSVSVASSSSFSGLRADLLAQPAAVPARFAEPKPFKVISSTRTVGILFKPDVGDAPTCHLKPAAHFDVDALFLDSATGRRFFRLADGRGWVAECSRKDPTRKAVEERADDVKTREKNRRLKKAKKVLLRRGPFVPRARLRTLKGGPADGAVVRASFFRSKSCLRGYSIRSGYVLPGGQELKGAGAKRRVLELASRIAPRLFFAYRTLQRELLQEFERRNEWDARRRRWRRRAAGAIPPRTARPTLALAVPPPKRPRPATKHQSEDASKSCVDVGPPSICDGPLAIEAGSLAIEDGALAIENGALAIQDSAETVEESPEASPAGSVAPPPHQVSPNAQFKAACQARARALLLVMGQQRQRWMAKPVA